ncbi:hypothetical protein LV780_12350 [Cereibacter azotoformans]|uniref:Uncharacterized protein n=1 Tax=Cereibacter azotoformans TaxID=43057 RepID=A0A2T5JYY7_9RHOB|nr:MULTISPECIES: hypothetical protein [Cereibacter]AXQ94531.1 hypothetical protein D0Z66_12380 [Cereibacter sphaeroides]MBO4170629.1 hypothetical protein [Cereibacter azotoformans]MWP39601.1 hypothetical protein [Cereibacter sphaeroides]PTR15369.1 hypothetical protein C8J28_11490 [Cereibacter azotoformans]UIJ30086.1 hypothetical protein LV780_12350 [Cereibacter azotoformans]
MTATAIRYPASAPVARFALLDLTEPQLRLLLSAAEAGLPQLDTADDETAAEVNTILGQAREALEA